MYQIEFSPQALKDISKFDKATSERITKRIEWFSQNVEVLNLQPLKGRFKGVYKLVVGDWRVLYTIDFSEKIITIHLIGHRREIYRI